MNDTRTILDVVAAISRELKYNKSFVELLRPVTDEQAKRITQSYLEWINKTMELEDTDH
jgi:hypothetical protein